MIFFKNDYGMGAHPDVMEALNKTNMTMTDGYGNDPYTKKAASLIKEKINCPQCDVHFFMAGTQTNLTALSAFLRPHQAVISPESGHICVHETGAVEATGHKVIHVPSKDGKITPRQVEEAVTVHKDEHYVMPKALYISNSTETGNIYTKSELLALKEVCGNLGLYLYMDGARLAIALTSQSCDLSMEDLPKLTDAFYIGGTKNGTLFGEALVIINSDLKSDFRYIMKQRGAILAKGRLLGIQFEALFKDDLYFRLGRHANRMADLLAQGIKGAGYRFDQQPLTNQLFPVFPNNLVNVLEPNVAFEKWSYPDDGKTTVRLVTSWATSDDDISNFMSLL